MKLDRTEMVVIGVAFVALVALVIAKYTKPDTTQLDTPPAEAVFGSQNSGPEYLMGNMPWAFQPWAPSVIPQNTSGQNGQVGEFTPKPDFQLFGGGDGSGQ